MEKKKKKKNIVIIDGHYWMEIIQKKNKMHFGDTIYQIKPLSLPYLPKFF